MTSVRIESLERRATELVDLLVDCGPLTADQACAKLNWSRGRFSTAVRFARENLCPDLGMAIPAVIPQDGWLYQITTEWEPVEAGASHTLGQVETRLAAIHRDVRIVLPNLARGSREWRRANFLNKHLGHVLTTLSEIENG